MGYRFVRYWFRFVSRPWLDTDIPSKHFLCLQDVFKTLQDMFSRRLQNMSSKTSWRRFARCLQDIFKMYLQDFFKTSSGRLGRRKTVTLKTYWRGFQDLPWRRLQDLLKTSKCLLGSFWISKIIEKDLERIEFTPKMFGLS